MRAAHILFCKACESASSRLPKFMPHDAHNPPPNTFPFIHSNFFHALMNILALTPLLERFESEYGTLTTLALFIGRECPRYPTIIG